MIREVELENEYLGFKYSMFYDISIINFSIEGKNTNINFLEKDSINRFNRFNNTLINYDYKTGNYVGY
jgi:hypothetical protein